MGRRDRDPAGRDRRRPRGLAAGPDRRRSRTSAAASVEEMRRTVDTRVALPPRRASTASSPGSGFAGRSDLAGQGFLAPRVAPDARRAAWGRRSSRGLAEHVELHRLRPAPARLIEDHGLARLRASVSGSREVGREVEQVRAIGERAPARVAAGVELVSLAERPDLFEPRLRELAREALPGLRGRPADRSLARDLGARVAHAGRKAPSSRSPAARSSAARVFCATTTIPTGPRTA